MINDQGKSDTAETEPELSPSPAHFDREASITAQPVEPLAGGHVADSKLRPGFRGDLVAGHTRALVAVVVLGLASGALGGMLLAKRSEQAPEASAIASEVSGVESRKALVETGKEGQDESQKLNSFAAQLNAASGKERLPVARTRKSRRVRTNRAPRAYRLGVIRE